MSSSLPNSSAAKFTPIDRLTKLAIILYLITTTVSIAAIFIRELSTADFAISVPSIVVNAIWFYRAYQNLPALGATGLRFTPKWAIIWWIIPVFNLWKPYEVTVEIVKSSDPSVWNTDQWSRPQLKQPTIILVWWLYYIIFTILQIFFGVYFGGSRMDVPNSPISDIRFGYMIALAIGSAISTFLSISVIREIARRQNVKIQSQSG